MNEWSPKVFSFEIYTDIFENMTFYIIQQMQSTYHLQMIEIFSVRMKKWF